MRPLAGKSEIAMIDVTSQLRHFEPRDRFVCDLFGRYSGASIESPIVVAPPGTSLSLASVMSVQGQKQTFGEPNRMSALPPKADIRITLRHVCFGP